MQRPEAKIKMIKHIPGSEADLLRLLPKNLTLLPTVDLQAGLDTSLIYIKVKVSHKFQIVREKTHETLLKVFVKEENENAEEIPVYFMGDLAEKCQAIAIGDMLALSNFLVETNTRPSHGRHKCQIRLDIYQNSLIFIIKPVQESTLPKRHRILFTDAVPSTSDNSAEKNWTTAINVLTVKSPPAGNLRSVGEIQTAGQSTDISVSTGQQHAPGPQTAAVRPQNPAVRPQNPAVSPQSLAPAVQATAQPAAAPKQTIQTGPQAAQHNNPAGPALMSPSKRQNLTLVPGKGQRDYTYTKLKNLKINTLVNVIGVVKFFKDAAPTRGTDQYMVISITDPSLEDPDSTMTKLKCCLFARDASLLPREVKIGDVIRLHRLSISTYKNDLQGRSGPGFSFAVFDGTTRGNLTPSTNTKTYTITDNDIKLVEQLRQWCERTDLLLDTQFVSSHDTFADMQAGKYYNVVCQVVGISEIIQDVHFLLKCWDGTTCQHSVYEVDIEELNSQAFLREDKALRAKANGFIYDVSIFDDHCESAAGVSVGDYVKFVNLHAMVHKNQATGTVHSTLPTVELCLHKGTNYGRRLVVLSNDDPNVRTLQAKLEEIVEQRRQMEEEMKKHQEFILQGDDQWQSNLPEIVVRDDGVIAVQMSDPDPQPSTSGMTCTSNQSRGLSSDTNAADQSLSVHSVCRTGKRKSSEMCSESANKSLTSKSKKSSDIEKSQICSNGKTQVSAKGAEASGNTEKTKETSAASKSSKNHVTPAQTDSEPQTTDEEIVAPSPEAKRSRKLGDRSSARPPSPARPSSPAQLVCNRDLPECLQKTATGKLKSMVAVILSHHNLEPVKVTDILTKSMSEATGKFRIKAQVIDYQPRATRVQDFLHLHCRRCSFLSSIPVSGGATLTDSMSEWCKTAQAEMQRKDIPYYACPKCPRQSPRKQVPGEMLLYTIAVKFLLEDDTGCLVAQLFKDKAVEFFDNIQPVKLLQDDRLFRRVRKELNSLLVESDSQESSIFDCCIMSYTTHVGVCFQIFDTVLSADLQ